MCLLYLPLLFACPPSSENVWAIEGGCVTKSLQADHVVNKISLSSQFEL